MTKPALGKKRNKITKILLLPILAMFFLVGWSFYWIGQKQTKQPKKKINTIAKQKEELELTVISEEEQTPLLS